MTTVPPPTPSPILGARGITRRDGQAEALRGADFTGLPAEGAALLGDSGRLAETVLSVRTSEQQSAESHTGEARPWR